VKDPVGTVKGIYATFGWDFTKDYEDKLVSYIAENKAARAANASTGKAMHSYVIDFSPLCRVFKSLLCFNQPCLHTSNLQGQALDRGTNLVCFNRALSKHRHLCACEVCLVLVSWLGTSLRSSGVHLLCLILGSWLGAPLKS
jgi:hypothetical protein